MRSVLRRRHCPICGTTALRFLSFGRPSRKHARCPGCGSLERHRFVWEYVSSRPELLAQGTRLLHLAPEPFLARELQRAFRVRYVSADKGSREAGSLHDLTRLGFASGCFDAVLCLHVLEHVVDDGAAMSEMRRVLRHGGWALIHVPLGPTGWTTDEDPAVTDPRLRLLRWGQEDHVRLYGIDMVGRLEAAGFRVRVESCSQLWDRRLIAREVLVPDRSADDLLLLATVR